MMGKKSGTVVVVAAATALLLSAGVAAAGLSIEAKPFNPGGFDVTVVAKKIDGAGNPGFIDNAGWLLALSETVTFPPGVSADLTVKGFSNPGFIVLTALGFDYLNTSHCTNGSPRFSVETANGGSYAFGCGSPTATRTDQGNGWTTVQFTDADVQVLAGPAWPGFASGLVTATFIQLLADEGPAMSIIDQIKINTTVIGK